MSQPLRVLALVLAIAAPARAGLFFPPICLHLSSKADVLYVRGRVETLDASLKLGDALAVRAGKVLAVGTESTLRSLYTDCGTRVVDLGGRTVLPGIVDAHTHSFASVLWGYATTPADSVVYDDLEHAQRLQLTMGITSQGEALAGKPLVNRLTQLQSLGRLKIRTSLYLRETGNCRDVFHDEAAIAPTSDPTLLLRIPGAKIFADGALTNPCGLDPATTWLHPDETGAPTYGDLQFDFPTLTDLVTSADGGGRQILVHAIGDRARDEVLDALGYVMPTTGTNPRRHRIEHNVFVRPEQIARYARFGIIPVVFGYHFTCDVISGVERSVVGIPDPSWYQPYQSMFSAGLRVAWHGDWRASDFATDTDDQLRSYFGALLHSLTTRVQLNPDGSSCAPPPWYAAEAVTPLQALRMMTINAAYALGTDSVVGSLEPGKFADLVIVNQDPLLLSLPALPGVRVVSTVVGGVPQSCAPEASSLCF